MIIPECTWWCSWPCHGNFPAVAYRGWGNPPEISVSIMAEIWNRHPQSTTLQCYPNTRLLSKQQ